MRKLLRFLGAVVLAFLLVAGFHPADAASYIKIGELEEELGQFNHKDWIIVESMSSTIAESTSLSGKRQLKPLLFTRAVDDASPKLQNASESGQEFPIIYIDVPFEHRDETLYLRYKMRNVVFSSYTRNNCDTVCETTHFETMSINYSRVELLSRRPKRAAED